MTGNGDGSPPTSSTVHVKLGTQSTNVYFHPDSKIEVGELVKYKLFPWEPWARWKGAYVHGVDPLPFLEMM